MAKQSRRGNVALRLSRMPDNKIQVQVLYRGPGGRRVLSGPETLEPDNEKIRAASDILIATALSKVRAPRQVKAVQK